DLQVRCHDRASMRAGRRNCVTYQVYRMSKDAPTIGLLTSPETADQDGTSFPEVPSGTSEIMGTHSRRARSLVRILHGQGRIAEDSILFHRAQGLIVLRPL